jgi:hypothetical protein
MSSYKPNPVLLVIFFMMIVVAAVATLVVGTFWLSWLGGWYGIFAIVFAYYMGVASRAIR